MIVELRRCSVLFFSFYFWTIKTSERAEVVSEQAGVGHLCLKNHCDCVSVSSNFRTCRLMRTGHIIKVMYKYCEEHLADLTHG